jgi:hypothetical protein
MNIALDFDQTYTEDPPLWDRFIFNSKARGHKVYLVTSRPEKLPNYPDLNADIDEFLLIHDIEVIYCSGGQKSYEVSSRGIFINVWIDDCPEGI